MRHDIFIGWIPNVAGRLSFSHIGASVHPAPCETENSGNALGRRLYVVQKRPLSDWLLPNWYFRFLYGYSADWRFVFVAKSAPDAFDQIARLEGEVLVFDETDWDKWEDTPNDGPTSLGEICTRRVRPWARFKRAFANSDEFPPGLDEIRSRSIFSYSVTMRRSGVLWIRPRFFNTDIVFADDYNSLPRRIGISDEKYLANQVFFFLKDISHNHRHHDRRSDTITEISAVDRRGSWAIETHYRIHRKIVEMRRSKDPETLFNATGILAYLSSLRAAVGWQANARRGPLTYNNAEIEASIKSSIEVLKWRQVQHNIIKTALPALGISLIALTGYENGQVGYAIREVINGQFETAPIRSGILILIAGIFVPFYYGVMKVSSLGFVVRAKRILVAQSAGAHAASWIIASFALFSAAMLQLTLPVILAKLANKFWELHSVWVSWGIVAASLGIGVGALFLLPVWPTRYDLAARLGQIIQSAVASRMSRLVHWSSASDDRERP